MKMENSSWHEWRSQGIGASDAPIIMGVSPWSTAYELWEQKTKRIVKDFSNFATDRGNRLEPKARALYELNTGLEFPAILCVNSEYSFIRASLDGYCADTHTILEIKCPGKADHEQAVAGLVPEKYWPQLQHQFLACAEAKECHYVSYDGENIAVVVVKPDLDYQKTLFESVCKFWKSVCDDKPPELSEKDFHTVRNPDLALLLTAYDELTAQVKLLDDIKEQILNHHDVVGRRVIINKKWKINLSYRKGNIDYTKVDALRNVDLETYRKSGSSYRTISCLKTDT